MVRIWSVSTVLMALAAVVCVVLGTLTGLGTGPLIKHVSGPVFTPAPRAPVVHIPTQTTGVAVTAPDGRGAIRPVPPLTGCTVTVSDPGAARDALAKAGPGQKICITGNLGDWRLRIGYSGTAQAPIQVVGDGQTRVGGIKIDAFNVIVEGFTVLNTKSPEIQIDGDNVTLRNTVARNPLSPGSDNVQLTGDNITMTHNTLGADSGNGGDANGEGTRANCIDILGDPTDPRASHHVRIEGNRCENIALNCLRAFSPPPGTTTARAPTSDVTFTNNYCQTRGTTAITADNVQHITITNNVVGPLDHAWALQSHSGAATISGNTIAPGTRYEVGMDESSQDGYNGLPPVGGPP